MSDIDFDIFDEPNDKPGRTEAAPSKQDVELSYRPEQTNQGESKEALINKETQAQIEHATAKAVAMTSNIMQGAVKLATSTGGAVKSYRPSVRMIKGVAGLTIAAAMTFGVIHFWPESGAPADQAAGQEASATNEAPGDVQTDQVPTQVIASSADMADILASGGEPAIEDPPQERTAPAQAAKPASTQPQTTKTQPTENAPSEWQDKANDDMDRFFQDLNNKE